MVWITNTSVVLGIATLGTPGATPGCDCATDVMGSAAMKKGSMDFIGFSFRFSLVWLLASGRYNLARNQHRDGSRFSLSIPLVSGRHLARLSDICPQRPACDAITNDRFLARNRSQTRLARQ